MADPAFQFVCTDLETGLLFARRALAAHDDQKQRDRNLRYARQAYDAIRQFVPRLSLTTDEAGTMGLMLEELRDAIDAIPTTS